MKRIAEMARSYQPGLLVVDRTVTGEYENYTTPEQEVPDAPLPFPWETCMTMGDSWSYVPNDNYKSSHKLIQLLVKIVSRIDSVCRAADYASGSIRPTDLSQIP